MNDKLFVFRSIFYGAVPQYQRVFLEKKQKALEEKLKKEKALYEKEMNAMSSKYKRKMKKQGIFQGGEIAAANEMRGPLHYEQPRGSGLTTN